MAKMSPVRRRMIEDMTIRNLSPATQRSYIHAVSKFSQYFHRSPERLGLEDVRAYQVHLASKGVAWASLNQVVCALRFFYGVTLGELTIPERIAYAREPGKLPVVLSADEVVRFLEAVSSLKARVALTTAYAAGLRVSEVAALKVIGECMSRHRHQEFLRFLRAIDRNTLKSLDLHLVVDNYATHKHPKVKAWLKRHPRFHLHFTPTSASWINLVERFFGLITDDAIRRGVFHSVAELNAAIEAYLEQHNAEPKPFVWTATAADILQKVARGRHALESVH